MDNKNPSLPCFSIFIIAKQCAFHCLFELILQTYHSCQLAASLQLPGRTLVKVTLSSGWIDDVAVARGRYSPTEQCNYICEHNELYMVSWAWCPMLCERAKANSVDSNGGFTAARSFSVNLVVDKSSHQKI